MKAQPAPPEAAKPAESHPAPPEPEKPATARKTARRGTKSDELGSSSSMVPMSAVFDYRSGQLPERVRELIETHLAIEAQDAKSAGSLGFMTRSLAIATLPHRKSADFRFWVLSRNRRKFRHPNSSPATSASKSIILPPLWKV